ncbi:hypothetical protein SAMN04488061_0231 [Filomicrobium insigne]|uniref:Uncharacterized protein n=1 Tax=Filomicrobium insigne TaxID=418854 RepID=A0A1H0GQC9_9HYPH|nr:hypothetical protein SAMN04488061_0231 [Filomicrobium insigne]
MILITARVLSNRIKKNSGLLDTVGQATTVAAAGTYVHIGS